MTDGWADAVAVATALEQHFEGCHLTSYRLQVSPGVYEGWATIGWGRAIPLAKHPMTITQAQADLYLKEDTQHKLDRLKAEIPIEVLAKLSPDALGAIISFRYNVLDSTWLSPRCMTRQLLKQGKIYDFADHLKQWNKGEGNHVMPGLQRRRKCERFLLKGHTLAELKRQDFFMHDYLTDNL